MVSVCLLVTFQLFAYMHIVGTHACTSMHIHVIETCAALHVQNFYMTEKGRVGGRGRGGEWEGEGERGREREREREREPLAIDSL